jgi:hypothetical protein
VKNKPVEIVNVCDVIDVILERFGIPKKDEYLVALEQINKWFTDWCIENDAAYYAVPRDEFDEREAIALAQREGRNKVVVEDLS